MTEPRKEILKTYDGECIVTHREMNHPKSKEKAMYLSFSNGQDVCGFYIGKDTIKDLVKAISHKGERRGRSTGSDSN